MKLKVLLTFSLAANLALSGSVIYFWQTRTEHGKPADVSSSAASTTPAAALPAKRFSWNEVESDSLMVYMDNLRSIGCPEDVISRIIRKDDPYPSATQEGRQGSAQGLANLSGPVTGREVVVAPSPVTISAAGIGYIAPVKSGSDPAVAKSGPTGSDRAMGSGGATVSTPPRRTVTPLAWQDGNAPVALVSPVGGGVSGIAAGGGSAAVLNEAQAAGINNVQDAFVDELSGSSRNANDPVYAQQWNAAQQRADDRLRAMLGDTAFMQYQLNAVLQGKK